MSRPLEAYDIRLEPGSAATLQAAGQHFAEGPQGLVRRVLRELISRTPDLPEGRASAGAPLLALAPACTWSLLTQNSMDVGGLVFLLLCMQIHNHWHAFMRTYKLVGHSKAGRSCY